MILRTIAFVLPLLGGDLPEVDPRPLVRKVAVEKKVIPIAREEHAKTLALRANWKGRRRQLAMERAAKEAVDEAPPPPVPMGPSTGMSTAIYIPIAIHVGTGGMPFQGYGGPQQQSFAPPSAGRVPDMYWATYAPIIRRMGLD